VRGPMGIFLSVSPSPYLPPLEGRNNVYTLVLDLDETLIHFTQTSKGGRFEIRPYG